MTYTLSDTNELTINWNMTSLLIQVCQYFYVYVDVTAKDCEIDCTISERSLIITKTLTLSQTLEACRAYTFTLDRGNGVDHSEDFRTKEQFEKVEVTLEEIESTILLASWSEPKLFPLCEKKFRVGVMLNNNEIYRSETSNLYETIRQLEPCESYVVSVYPMSQNEAVPEYGVSINHTMAMYLPSGIQNLNVTYEPSDYSIKIDWQRPANGSRCVKSYEVKIESDFDNRTRNVTTTYEGFTNVYACIDYYVKINSLTLNDINSADVVTDIRIPSRGDFNFLLRSLSAMNHFNLFSFLGAFNAQDSELYFN